MRKCEERRSSTKPQRSNSVSVAVRGRIGYKHSRSKRDRQPNSHEHDSHGKKHTHTRTHTRTNARTHTHWTLGQSTTQHVPHPYLQMPVTHKPQPSLVQRDGLLLARKSLRVRHSAGRPQCSASGIQEYVRRQAAATIQHTQSSTNTHVRTYTPRISREPEVGDRHPGTSITFVPKKHLLAVT